MSQEKYRKNLCKFIEERRNANEALRKSVIADMFVMRNEILKLFPSITRIVLVGSVVSGGFTPNSDVDIVVNGLLKKDYFNLFGFLGRTLNRKIDLIVEEDLSVADRKHILHKCEVIYDRKKN